MGNCWPQSTQQQQQQQQKQKQKQCIFCLQTNTGAGAGAGEGSTNDQHEHANEEEDRNEIKQRLLYEDELIYIVPDIKPAAKTHLLVIPKQHIESVHELTHQHKQLVEHMHSVATSYVTQRQAEARAQLESQSGADTSDNIQMGYHVPPFISVKHLHLHVFEKPFHSSSRAIKYVEWGWWYRTGSEVSNKLNKLTETAKSRSETYGTAENNNIDNHNEKENEKENDVLHHVSP